MERKLIWVVLACTSAAQTQSQEQRPRFDVVSVKPSNPASRGVRIGSPSPGRFHAENVWLRFLIQSGWDIKDYQIVGGPPWAGLERFNIDATADSHTSREQMRVMIQTMLEDRFKLVWHRATKELPVYDLIVSKSGPKLTSSPEGSCVDRKPGAPPPAPDSPPPNFCGASQWSQQDVNGSGITMQQFVTILSQIVQHPVIDKTGITGKFDVHLKWTPDQTTPGLLVPGVSPSPVPSADDSGPTLFSVLAEQLGLRLQASKAPVEVVVVDSAERPSAN